MTGPVPPAPAPGPPPASTAPPPAPMAPPPPGAPPAAPAAPHPSAMAEVAAVEARAQAALGGLSGGDTLIVGGAALLLIIGEIILGLIFGASGNSVFSIGGISLQGVLSGEVILFVWISRPTNRMPTISTVAARTIVLALVLAVALYELGELILVIKNLSGFFNSGFVTILAFLCRIIGAAAMVLGVVSNWMPAPATPVRRP